MDIVWAAEVKKTHGVSTVRAVLWGSVSFMYSEVIIWTPTRFYDALLLPSIFPSFKVFSNVLTLHIRWPEYWSFSISPSSECSGLIFFRINWFDLLAVKGLSRVFSSTTVLKHQFLGTQPSLWSSSHIHTWLLEKPQLWLWPAWRVLKSDPLPIAGA